MKYRRNFIPGGSFFVTVVTHARKPILATPNSLSTLRDAFRTVRGKHPFQIDAIVVLPDHLHCIWTLPSADNDFAVCWRLIKTYFTRHADPALRSVRGSSQIARGEQAVWQKRYWEHTLRDELDFIRHVEYIHYNPVKHGYVHAPIEWPHSSFHRYVAAGLYPDDWGAGPLDFGAIGRE